LINKPDGSSSANYYFTYFKGGKKILPYAGLRLGTQFSDQTMYFNIYSIGEDNRGFMARPEIGAIFTINESVRCIS